MVRLSIAIHSNQKSNLLASRTFYVAYEYCKFLFFSFVRTKGNFISTWLSRIIPIFRSVDYGLLILFSILKYSGIIGNSKWARIRIHVRMIVYTSCYNLVTSCFFSLRHLKTAVMTSISSNNRTAGKLTKHCLSLDQKIKISDEVKKRKRKSCREIVDEFKID